MKLLWLSCNALFPLNRGGNIRTYNILKKLKSRHNITYLSYLDDSYMPEIKIKENMRQCCNELIYIKEQWERKYSFRFYTSLIKNIFSTYPYVISKYYSRSMRDLCISTLKQNFFDIIICDFLFPSIFLPKFYHADSILFQHNIEANIWQRHFKIETNILKKWYFYFQWLKLIKYEKAVCQRFKACVAVSEGDEKTLKNFGVLNTGVIPTGVDTHFFCSKSPEERPFNLVFTGSMDWLPNEDAVVYFADFIFPKIKRSIPQATFTIVGRQPSEKVIALGKVDPSIEITGTVEDVRPYIDRSSVYVVPIRIGGGTRLKIYEAMSMGKCVVSTSIGAEGLEYEDGENILIEDDADDFAKCTIRLLSDNQRRNQIGESARRLVKNKFDWGIVANEFEQICIEFTENQ
jgi:glycosyltransferase involved in cell wall biosynthesis